MNTAIIERVVPVAVFSAVLVGLAGCGFRNGEARLLHERAWPVEVVEVPGDRDGSRSESLGEDPDLDDYVRVGLHRSAALRAAYRRWLAAMHRIPEARQLPEPMLEFVYFVEELQTRTGAQRGQAALSQAFPWFGTLARRGDAAAARAEVAWWKVEAARVAVVRRIKRAWYARARLAELTAITATNLQLLEDLEPNVQRRIEAGGDQAALLRLQVAIAEVGDRLRSLRAREPVLAARLRAAANLSADVALPPARFPPAPVEGPPPAETLRALLTEANPELRGLRRVVAAADADLALARLSGYPDFRLGVRYFETDEATMSTPGSGDDPLAVSLAVSLPIWRDSYRAQRRRAGYALAAAGRDVAQREADLEAELAALRFAVEDADRQLALSRETLIPRARQSLELTVASFETGRAGITDLLEGERDLLRFEEAYWRARADRAIAIADLEALCGGSLAAPEEGAEP